MVNMIEMTYGDMQQCLVLLVRDGDFEFDEQTYFTPVPNIGPERLSSTKIRIESSSLEFGNLSPFRRSEVSSFDFILQLILTNLVFSFLL